MERRAFLKGAAGLGAVAGCSIGQSVMTRASGKGVEWGYEGAHGPENWGGISEKYAVCGSGHEQSPIDLKGPIPSVLNDLAIEYGASSLNVVNNGHTIKANIDPGSRLLLGGKPYRLLQFHFHHPSEHTVAGKRYPMEVHFVHLAEDGALAALGVFMEGGAGGGPVTDVFDAVLGAAPKSKGAAKGDGKIVPAHLLPTNRAIYRYAGSLTTPPCSEIVTWSVFASPIRIRYEQIEAFAELYPMNARPLQAINRRFLLGNF